MLVTDESEQGMRALREGNLRFRAVKPAHPHQDRRLRADLVSGQRPFAVVLSCADSRVPPEIVFDQGLGDLFTVRTAGQVLDGAVLGTLAFGVAELGIGLVVVLGHSSCGAVAATVDAIDAGRRPGGHVGVLVDAVGPVIAPGGERAARVAAGVDANVRRVVDALRADPETAGATIVGARYDLDTCAVTEL